MNLIRASLFVAAATFLQNAFATAEHDYPRIMAIAIGIPVKYDQPAVQKDLARADVVILGFWPYWKENENKSAQGAVQALKKINPKVLVGQYTNLNEAKGKENADKTSIDVANKIDQEGWWLKGPTGGRVQHTSTFGAWDVNISNSTKADGKGMRYPQWYAQRNYDIFFKRAPALDFWFLDISVPESPVTLADWDNTGIPMLSSLPNYSKKYREGHRAYWDAIRKLQPTTMLIGNVHDISSTEYQGQLNGALFEAAMGLSWSLYERQGWEPVRKRYYQFFKDTKAPNIVGFNVWGPANDYQRARFGLTTCLMNDGYFSYTDPAQGYMGTIWFDEFNFDIGKPIEAPPQQAWSNGVYRRLFEKGAVFVNTTNKPVTINLNDEYERFKGTQAPEINSGKSVNTLEIQPKDGIILAKKSPPAPPTLHAVPQS